MSGVSGNKIMSKIVYNITIKILPEIEEAWLQWQRREHIPEVMATGYFTGFRFFKLLEQDEEDGRTYVVQFLAEDKEKYQQYIDNCAGALRQKTFDRWGNRFIAFRTLLQEMD